MIKTTEKSLNSLSDVQLPDKNRIQECVKKLTSQIRK